MGKQKVTTADDAPLRDAVQHPSIMLTWESFKSVFEHGKRPYWWLYQGKDETRLIGNNSDNENMVDSWESLSQLVDLYGPGVYTVEARTSANAGRGNTQHTFCFGDEPAQAAGIAGTGARSASPDHSAAFVKGIDMRYWLDKADAQNDRIRKLELELMEARNRNERLKDEIRFAEKPDLTERILGVVEKQPQILSHITGMFAGGMAPTAIGNLKANKPIPPVDPDEDEYDDDEECDDDAPQKVAAVSRAFSLDRAVTDCYRLIKALPDQDINDLLTKLANVAERDPAKIKMAINYL